jgi:hypothetical protein
MPGLGHTAKEAIMSHGSENRGNHRSYGLRPTEIWLKGHRFRVHDIGAGGIGLILEKDGPRLFIGERIDRIPLPLEAGTLLMPGVVSHITVTAKCTVVGIHLQPDASQLKDLHRFQEERSMASA